MLNEFKNQIQEQLVKYLQTDLASIENSLGTYHRRASMYTMIIQQLSQRMVLAACEVE